VEEGKCCEGEKGRKDEASKRRKEEDGSVSEGFKLDERRNIKEEQRSSRVS